MKTLSILSFCTLILMSCNNHKSTKATGDNILTLPVTEIAQNVFHQKALDDLKKNELKYYFQSIHYPSKAFILYMKDSLNITVQSASDNINIEFSAYNQTIDSIVFAQKGIHIDSLIRKVQ